MKDGKEQDKNLYQLMFQTATEGLIVANKYGQIELVNPRASELFGYDKEELLNLTVDDLLPKHLKARHVQHREGFMESPRKRSMGIGFDLIGVRKDGTSFPLEISLNHFIDNGEPKAMALIMDVTKRKEQEAEIKLLNKHLEKRVLQRTKQLDESQKLYKLIAQNFPNGTINVFDSEFNYVFTEGAELFKRGITSEKLIGKYYLDRLPEELSSLMHEILENALQGKNEKHEIRHQNQYYLVSTVGLNNDEGEIDRVLLVEQNITERKLAEETTKEALSKEKLLNELKSRFVSMASHEFRTPLSTVLSSLALLEKYDAAGIAENKPKHYKRIKSSVRHLTNLLNDFLSLEKVEAGKINMAMEQLDVKTTLEELVDQHKQMAKDKQIIIYEHQGEQMMTTDQNMLQIMCSNLLSNAIKYSSNDSTIQLSSSMEDDTLTIKVKDQGIGIPYEDQENMFSSFFRAKNAVNIEGTGLGLNIVSRYLQLLKGTITFESVPDEGTTFTVIIPNHQKNEANITD